MPLRDHFRPPTSQRSSWEGLHGGWPMVIVQKLSPHLPKEYTAEPRVHLGAHEYEVLVYDQSRGRQLVAAVELVSPANKDRPENRAAILSKCMALLQQGVCVSLVDLVTTRQFNLYMELLSMLGHSDPGFAPQAPTDRPISIYAATCRAKKIGQMPKFEAWAHPLMINEPLPTIPLWLNPEVAVPLELEASYEDTCRTLRIE